MVGQWVGWWVGLWVDSSVAGWLIVFQRWLVCLVV